MRTQSMQASYTRHSRRIYPRKELHCFTDYRYWRKWSSSPTALRYEAQVARTIVVGIGPRGTRRRIRREIDQDLRQIWATRRNTLGLQDR